MSSECAAHAVAAGPGAADVMLVGRIVTLDAAHPEVEALAVRDGRIVAVGARSAISGWIGERTKEMRLPGVALPGFAEAHGHPEGVGRPVGVIDLHGLSKAKILERVAEAARSAAPGAWIHGDGWDEGFFQPSLFPTAAELDGVAGEHPVFLSRVDGHSAWLNSRALALAKVTATTVDPDGGKILRDAGGAPTGILVDHAVGLARRAIPPPTHAERLARLSAALDQYVAWGITSLHDAGEGLEEIALYKELLAAGKLPLRVYAMAAYGKASDEYLARGPEVDLGGRLTIRCFKVVLDGALGSRGAELSGPYTDAPSESGLVLVSDDAFRKLIARATERGFQVAAHAIGDRAVHRALDAYEAAGPKLRALRPRIEHASLVAPADVPRFDRLGVVASMQPVFVGEYGRWLQERVGPERIRWVMPTRRLLETGAVVASGTDYPASDSGDPIVTLYSLLTRAGADGKPDGGLMPEERVGIDQALRSMTETPAYAAFQETDRGALTVGRLADITVLSGDPRMTPPERIRDLRVLATVVGGTMVYTADEAARRAR
jgi:predicted amidohydrolase YtcJ